MFRPFVSGGIGVARLEPQLDVAVDGIISWDVFGLTSFGVQNKTMALASAGNSHRHGRDQHLDKAAIVTITIFSHFQPDTSLNNDRILTTVNSVYAALGLRF